MSNPTSSEVSRFPATATLERLHGMIRLRHTLNEWVQVSGGAGRSHDVIPATAVDSSGNFNVHDKKRTIHEIRWYCLWGHPRR